MKSNLTLPSLVLVVMSAALLVLSGCSDNGSNNKDGGSTPPPATTPTTTIFPAINPPFDAITEVAVSPDPEGPFDDVLEPDADYTYDPATESITSTSSVDPGGAYVRITGLATVTGTQSSYTVYTYIASGGVQVAANELTSAAVGLVASGGAADFNAALTLVETEFGLPMGSAAEAVPADQRSAELTSVLAAAAPAFASGADPAFDVADFDLADLTAAQGGYVECVAQGGLAWDSWHKTDAGGSALPTDEPDNDYTRCKACHGWDQQGTEGGYVRRSRKGEAPAGGGPMPVTRIPTTATSKGRTPRPAPPAAISAPMQPLAAAVPSGSRRAGAPGPKGQRCSTCSIQIGDRVLSWGIVIRT